MTGHGSDEEHCHLCGKPVAVVWTAPDEMWATITDRADGGGILCVRCFDDRAFGKDILLRWVPQPLGEALATPAEARPALGVKRLLERWGVAIMEAGGDQALIAFEDDLRALAATVPAAPSLDVEQVRKALVATIYSHDPDGAAMWAFEFAIAYLSAGAEAAR